MEKSNGIINAHIIRGYEHLKHSSANAQHIVMYLIDNSVNKKNTINRRGFASNIEPINASIIAIYMSNGHSLDLCTYASDGMK